MTTSQNDSVKQRLRQLALALPIHTSMKAADYIVTGCNGAAVAQLLQAWPHDWPHKVAILWGSAGSGKTHLARLWQQKSAAHSLDPASLLTGLLANHAAILIDNIDTLIHQPDMQTHLFHLINHQQNHDGYLLLTAQTAPKQWPIALADLSSRLLAAYSISLPDPDDDLLMAVMHKQFSDRQIKVNDSVLRYMVRRIERSFHAASQWVERLDNAALQQSRPITVDLARSIMEADEP